MQLGSFNISTLGPAWNFHPAESLVSLSLQARLRSGTIITHPSYNLCNTLHIALSLVDRTIFYKSSQ